MPVACRRGQLAVRYEVLVVPDDGDQSDIYAADPAAKMGADWPS